MARLVIRKSFQDFKFTYFKNKVIKILNTSNDINKSFPLGTVRIWNGIKYKKTASDKWERVYENESRYAKEALEKLKKDVDKCTNSQQLLNLVLLHRERFCYKDGSPLPIVKELSEYVSAKNDYFESKRNITFVNQTEFDKKVLANWVNKDVLNEAYNLSQESVKLKEKARRIKKNAKTKQEKKVANGIMEQAKLLSRDAIYSHYDNSPVEIGKIQPLLMVCFPFAKNNNIYCGKAHLVDHMVNHHPELPLEKYFELGDIVNIKNDIYFDIKNDSFAFVKKDKSNNRLVVVLKGDIDRIVLLKTEYNTEEKLTNKFKKISLDVLSRLM